MGKKRLIYGCLLMLTVGFFIAGKYFASDGLKQTQFKENSSTDPVEVTDISLSTPSEAPSVRVVEVGAMPNDTVLQGAVFSQSIIGNGQGYCSFKYNARIDGKKELLKFYVHNKV